MMMVMTDFASQQHMTTPVTLDWDWGHYQEIFFRLNRGTSLGIQKVAILTNIDLLNSAVSSKFLCDEYLLCFGVCHRKRPQLTPPRALTAAHHHHQPSSPPPPPAATRRPQPPPPSRTTTAATHAPPQKKKEEDFLPPKG